MTPDEIAEIRNGLDEVFEEVAGDAVILVDEEGVQTALTCIAEDLAKSEGDEGLEIDSSGMRSGLNKRLYFLKKELAAKGVELNVTQYFLIDGERWDYAEDFPLRKDIVPLAGIHNMIEVIVRLAVERNRSIPGSEFGYAE
jgi:hypothetical protein